jgi:hypothetical protein
MSTSSEMTPDRILTKLVDDMDRLDIVRHTRIIRGFCEDLSGLTDIDFLKMKVREEAAAILKVLGEDAPDG